MLVVGAGGGIATMAIALAVAAGASITVTSSSTDTIERAVAAGRPRRRAAQRSRDGPSTLAPCRQTTPGLI